MTTYHDFYRRRNVYRNIARSIGRAAAGLEINKYDIRRLAAEIDAAILGKSNSRPDTPSCVIDFRHRKLSAARGRQNLIEEMHA